MTPKLYWIPAVPVRLAIMARPRGGEWLADEVKALGREGVDVVVSLLTPDEVAELGLSDEPVECAKVGIAFREFPIADRGVPESKDAFHAFAAQVLADLDAQRAVGIHCRAGIGRLALVAAGLLALRGIAVDQAFGLIAAARGCPVPDTAGQRAWAAELAERF